MNFKLKKSTKKGPKKYGLFIPKPTQSITSTQTSNKLAKQKKIESQLNKIKNANPNIFDYDHFYENDLQNIRANKQKLMDKDKQQRNVKYITKMKAESEIRKKRIGIIEEKKNYKERKKTDHLFNKNESYITNSFTKYINETKLQEMKDNIQDKTEQRIDKGNSFDYLNTLYNIKTNNGSNSDNDNNRSSNDNERINSRSRSRSRSRDRNIDDIRGFNEDKFNRKEDEYYRDKYIKIYGKQKKSEHEIELDRENRIKEMCRNKITKDDVQAKRAAYLERIKNRKKRD